MRIARRDSEVLELRRGGGVAAWALPALALAAAAAGAGLVARAISTAQDDAAALPIAGPAGGFLLAVGLGLAFALPRVLGRRQSLRVDRIRNEITARTTSGARQQVVRRLDECVGVEQVAAAEAVRAMTGQLRSQLEGEGQLGRAIMALADYAERQPPAGARGRYLRLRFADGGALLLPNEAGLSEGELEAQARQLREFLSLAPPG